MSKSFEFELGQRVNVPGYDAPGVVIAATGDVIDGVTYHLKWLDIFGMAQEGTWTADEVEKANFASGESKTARAYDADEPQTTMDVGTLAAAIKKTRVASKSKSSSKKKKSSRLLGGRRKGRGLRSKKRARK